MGIFVLLSLIAVAFIAESLASSSGQCVFHVDGGMCCKNTYEMATINYTTCGKKSQDSWRCIATDEQIRHCSNYKLPGIDSAHPLGMQSGMIIAGDISVPDAAANMPATNARLFSSTRGWKPSDAYRTGHSKAISCFSKLTRIPKQIVQSAPVFIEVSFTRMKKIQYLIIQGDGQWFGAVQDRRFIMSYRSFNGKSVPYGEHALLTEILACKGVFGLREPQCRFALRSFRARSIKVAGVDYSTADDDKWRLEFGGQDYMEADHWWRFDLLKKDVAGVYYFPNERGNLKMVTDRTTTFEGGNAFVFASTERGYTDQLPVKSCFADPELCKDGMSIGFWLKVSNNALITESATGQGASVTTGYRIRVEASGDLTVNFWMKTKALFCQCQKGSLPWNHMVVTFSLKSGINIYVNGLLAKHCNSATSGNHQDIGDRKIKVGPSGGPNLNIYDLKLWSFTLELSDVAEEHSPGTGTKRARDNSIFKLRPKSCVEAMAAFGTTDRVYDVYPLATSVQLMCLQKATGGKTFYLFPNRPTSLVTKFSLSNASPHRSVTYELDSNSMNTLISGASSCTQTVTYRCKHVRLTGQVQVYGQAVTLMSGVCSAGASCNCDANTLNELRDTQVFNAKSSLPITKITVSNIATYNDFLDIAVGPVECVSDHFASCGAALTASGVASGTFYIGNGIQAISVRCALESGEVKTSISHLDSNKWFHVTGYEARGSYKKNISYNQNFSSIVKIIEASNRCQQLVDLKCTASVLSADSYLTNRNNEGMKYWAGGPSSGAGCACGINKTCVDNSKLCNCDINDYTARRDVGFVTKKVDLPLTSINLGDTGSGTETKDYMIGDVECFSNHFASCGAALTASGVASGTFYIGNGIQAISVRCALESGEVKTSISHLDSNKWFHVTGYEGRGSYKKNILYNQNFSSIVKVIEASHRCQQLVDLKCTHSMISYWSYLTNRNNERMKYWAGGPSSGAGCACGINKTCVDNRKLCNCDKNDYHARRDVGFVTKKVDLPLTSINLGDTGHGTETKDYMIGDVECFSTAPSPSNVCAASFQHDGKTHTKCIDSNDSYGLWCKDISGTKIYCKTEEAVTDDTLMQANGYCIFPFKYKAVWYSSCISMDKSALWCSTTSSYSGKWRYCYSSLPKANIDFTMNSMDKFGDWKLGSSCTGEANSGPCGDMSSSSKPSENLANSSNLLEFTAPLTTYSTYNLKTFNCNPSSFSPDTDNALTAVTYTVADFFKPTALKEAVLSLQALGTGGNAEALVYVVFPPDCSDPTYTSSCRYRYFDAGIRYGPVVWKVGALSTGTWYNTPNLAQLIEPILKSNVNCPFTIVLQWKIYKVGSYSFTPRSMLVMKHQDKAPENYLYADSVDAQIPGKPLVYHTRWFSPVFQCLQFWFHMQGKGIGTLAVNIKQDAFVEREIFRIRGDQGTSWVKASVPIASFLDKDGSLFNLAFIAIREAEIARSIAIDDISVLPGTCTQIPTKSASRNMARSMKTEQISTIYSALSSYAVDGNPNSCTHTDNVQNPWWKVDFTRTVIIGSVRIVNRKDCCFDRLSNIEVRVANSTAPSSNTLCAEHASAVGAGATIELICSQTLYGRYLFVILKKTTALTLCEVEVYPPVQDASAVVPHLPRPLLLIPLDLSVKTLEDANEGVVGTVPAKKTGVTDKFSYPLQYSRFGNVSGMIFSYKNKISISGDFTFSLHVRPSMLVYFTMVEIATLFFVKMHAGGEVSLSFKTVNNGMVTAMSKPILKQNTWMYLSFSYAYHLSTVKIFADGKLSDERRVGYVKPSLEFTTFSIAVSSHPSLTLDIACIQFYKTSLDPSVIRVLDLCPNRHVSDFCQGGCSAGGICDQISGKCICLSYSNRFVFENCTSAMKTTVYKNAIKYSSFDERETVKGHTYPTIASAKNASQHVGLPLQSSPFFFIPGPINSAKCTWTNASTSIPLPDGFCLKTGSCSKGVSVSFWVLMAPLTDWRKVGNVTIAKIGVLDIQYGIIDNVLGCNRSKIASLFISGPCFGSRCIWLTTVQGKMLSGVWSHIAITLTSSNTLSLYYNGKLEHAVKRYRVSPAPPSSGFMFTFNLAYSCYDELAYWNQHLSAADVLGVYNAAVYNGKPAIRHGITFKRLTMSEPDSLWGVDTSGTAYRYSSATWKPVPQAGIYVREIFSGHFGVFAVHQTNLYRRIGITPEKPIGESWELITMSGSAQFDGSIVEIGSLPPNDIVARSAASWHCGSVADISPVLQKPVSGLNLIQHIKCTRKYCWAIYNKRDVKKYRPDTTRCTVIHDAKSFLNKKPEGLAIGEVRRFPFVLMRDDKKIYQINEHNPNLFEAVSNNIYQGVAAMNGLPVGITKSGKIDLIKNSIHGNLFRIRHISGLCLARRSLSEGTLVIKDNCAEIFSWTNGGCLVHAGTNKFVQDHAELRLGDNCREKDIFQQSNSSLMLQQSSGRCVHIDENLAYPATPTLLKIARFTNDCNKKSRIFFFETVGTIKNLTSHYLSWPFIGPENGDVQIEITATLRIYSMKWTEYFGNPLAQEAMFVYGKFRHELKQHFAGNINYHRVKFGILKDVTPTSNSSLMYPPVDVECTAQMYFGHFGEEERSLMLIPKFRGTWSDCAGFKCKLNIVKSVGVYLKPPNISLLNITRTNASFVHYPEHESTQAAFIGYNVSLTGIVGSKSITRSIYRQYFHKEGDFFTVLNLHPFFNYTSSIQLMFVQGTGAATEINFSTLESTPTEAPNITCSRFEQHLLWIEITSINDKNWKGTELGYRAFYKDILQLKSVANNIAEIQATYEHADMLIQGPIKTIYYMNITNLTVFTNYSLVVSALTNAGVGVFSQIYCRTSEGAPEVAPSDFEATAENSTHILANWSALTTDINILNAWFLSGYTLTAREVSEPLLATQSGMSWSVGANISQFLLGPFEEGRNYELSIAGNVNGTDGVNASICVSTDEAVPAEAPRSLTICGSESTSITLITGNVSLVFENGQILYYNFTVQDLIDGSLLFYQANITADQQCSNETCDSLCGPSSIVGKARAPSSISSHNCSSEPVSLPSSSLIIKHKISDLLYWTNYSIQVSACNSKGCGVLSKHVSASTDEYIPLCAPNVTFVGNLSSTSLAVTWQRLSRNCSNGLITHSNVFVIEFEELSNLHQCFNVSQCWEAFNSTQYLKKFYSTSKLLNAEINGLKKYRKYCIAVQAVNRKGFGPVSHFQCVHTAEDNPDGPPVSLIAVANSSTSVEVTLQEPAPDVVNGIIIGYAVYYSTSNGEPMKAIIYNSGKNASTGIIDNLIKFTSYSFFGAALTTKGPGPNITIPVKCRTLEDIPTAPPRNASVKSVSENGSVITFQETAPKQIHGILDRFLIKIIEKRRNGDRINVTAIAFASNATQTEQINATTSNVTQPDSNATDANSTNLQKFASFQLNISNYIPGRKLIARCDKVSKWFAFVLNGLLPFTEYDIFISTCTRIGCGPFESQSLKTDESVPSSAPVFEAEAKIETNSLTVSWKDIPIMEQNGIIISYTIKWMKNCYYLRNTNQVPTADCVRVLPSNITEFNVRVIETPSTNITVRNLAAYTRYLFIICAETSKGLGACRRMIYMTDEGIPCLPPNVTSIFDTTGKSIKQLWDNVLPHCQNGIIRGYHIYFKKLNPVVELAIPVTDDKTLFGNYSLNATTSFPPPNSRELKNLALRTNYSFMIAAYTSKGAGPNSTFYFMATGDFKHGNWSAWSEWTFCSASCGGGINRKTRLCTNPAPFNGGDDCKGPSSETKTCNTQICSGPYMGSFGQSCKAACDSIGFYCKTLFELHDSSASYKKLGLKCTDNTTMAKWSQKYHPSFRSDGRCEGFVNVPNYVACNESAPNDGRTRRICDCISPADCGCESWAAWGICTKTCGVGHKTRKRKCNELAWCPLGRTMQRLECGDTPCAIDGSWGSWSQIFPCNKSCGYGYKHRYRKCDSPKAAHGGDPCPGPSTDVIPECNTHKCPVHGQWGNWGEWRTCNQPCGGGTSIRKRYCNNPAPRYLGKYCEGVDEEGRICNERKCEGVEILFQVSLADFKWDYTLVYKTNPETIKISNALTENINAVYDNSDYISAVNVKNLYEGSVVANFSIFYVRVQQAEILLLQDTISTTGMLNNLSTVLQGVQPMNALADPPRNLTAVSNDPFSVHLRWLPPPQIASVVNISGYYVFYREFSSSTGSWSVAGVPGLNSSSFNLTDLKAFTKYRIRMTLAVRSGNGPASKEVVLSTVEGVPSVAPTGLKLTPSSSGGLRVEWNPIPAIKFNGRKLGYRIKYRVYAIDCDSCKYSIATVANGINEITLMNIQAFTLYDVEVEAYSGAGHGLPVSGTIKTPEGAPQIAPPSVAVKQLYSTSQLVVTWKEIPLEFTNGILLGYKIRYIATHVSNTPLVGATAATITKDKYTFLLKINGLQSYTKYSITIQGFTSAGDGPTSIPIIAETCKCPSDIFLNYYPNPPYVTKVGVGKLTGLIADLAQGMIKSSCGKCANVASNIHLLQSLSGEDPEKKSELEVKQSIGREFHASFPIFGRSTQTKYMEVNVFVLFVESSGSATIVRNEVDYAATTLNVFKSIGNIWPMYLIIIVFTTVAGILIWGAERGKNDEFSRGNYFNGVVQGFWWAFISMTTVGYGDLVPRTFLGRIIAIMWTLCGLVLSGILLGSLTSSVTTMTLPPAVKLYGTESAAVNDSFEAYLGVRRNSKVNTKRAYLTTTQVLDALKNKEVNIALLDAFAAASLQTKLKADSLKVKEVISANTGYGVILSKDFVRLEKDFRSYVASNQRLIASFIANMSKINLINDEVSEVPMLFDPTTKLFWQMIKTEGYLLLICSILGLCWSFYLTAKKRKAKVISADGVLLREMETLDENVDDFQESLTKKLDLITKRHDSEVGELLRLKKSYKRYRKRNNLDFHPLGEEASPRLNDTKISVQFNGNDRKYAMEGQTAGYSET